MRAAMRKNLNHFFSGVIKVELLPEALKCIAVGSRRFVLAVKAFQEAYGLLVDGELGPITMDYIESQNKQKAVKKKKKEKSAPEKDTPVVDSE
jgi:murein L,D-transpeptidase YcbB/YkuD